MSSSASNEHRGQCVRLAACVVALLVWMGLIFFMSANDGDHSQGMSDGVTSVVLSTVWPGYSGMSPDEQAAVVKSLSFPVRKAGHFSEYAVLGLLAFATLRQGQVLRSSQAIRTTRKIASAAAGAVVIAFVYACFDEFTSCSLRVEVGSRSMLVLIPQARLWQSPSRWLWCACGKGAAFSAVLVRFRHRCDMLLSVHFSNRCFPKARIS